MESQSRYSIVERLTEKKLEIMDKKNKLSENIFVKEQEISQKERDLKNWEKAVAEDVPRTRIIKEQEIDSLKERMKKEKELVVQNTKHYEEQMQQLQVALDAIQTISKDAPTPQEQKS